MKGTSWGQRGIVRLVSAALLAAPVVLVLGCAHDSDETPRSVVQVYSLNGNLPVQSDLYNYGPNKDLDHPEDDYVPIDEITVQFISHPSDPALTLEPGQAFGTVTFSKYTIDFAKNDLDGDGTDDIIDLVNYPMNAVVPLGGLSSGTVLVVPGGWKTIQALGRAQGTLKEYLTTAHITFNGEEETSHDPVQVDAGFVIGFADYADRN